MAKDESYKELIDWLSNNPWERYLYDQEVHQLITQLRERVELLSTDQDASDAHGKKEAVASGEVTIKVVVVGDGAVGKTSLLMAYALDRVPEDYVPTVFENTTKVVQSQQYGCKVTLRLWDTAGQEEYERLRPLSYPGADIVLLCFSVDAPDTAKTVTDKWYLELTHHIPDIPIVLVGTKIDLRSAEGDANFVSEATGKSVAQEINAIDYIEVSALKRIKVNDLFERVMQIVIERRQRLDKYVKESAATRKANNGGNNSWSNMRSTTLHTIKRLFGPRSKRGSDVHH